MDLRDKKIQQASYKKPNAGNSSVQTYFLHSINK
jgi:hypothetical protein